MNILGVCFKLLSTVLWLLFLQTDGKIQIPILNADIIDAYNQTSFKFECRTFSHPKGGVHFLVNNKSVNVMRFANNKCYNKSSECRRGSCYCSYKDYSFIWFYNVTGYSIHSTFGVVIKIATVKQPEVIMITISGIYDTTDFKVRETLYEVIRLSKEDDIKPTLIPEPCQSKSKLEKLLESLIPIHLYMAPLLAFAGVLDKTFRDSSSRVMKAILLIVFVIYFGLSLVVLAVDMNTAAKICSTVFCCFAGMCLLYLRKRLNSCLESSNAADTSIVRQQSHEMFRTDEGVPLEANDQPTEAGLSS